MKLVDRGYILVKQKQAFCDWAKIRDSSFIFDETDDLEGTIYLIEADFFDDEKVLEQNFKKIIYSECEPLIEEENDIPKLTIEEFLNWFEVSLGSTVFDSLK